MATTPTCASQIRSDRLRLQLCTPALVCFSFSLDLLNWIGAAGITGFLVIFVLHLSFNDVFFFSLLFYYNIYSLNNYRNYKQRKLDAPSPSYAAALSTTWDADALSRDAATPRNDATRSRFRTDG